MTLSDKATLPKRDSTVPVAIILGSFLAASTAPTPLYRFYQESYGISPVVITLVFGVYAFALLKSLLVAGSISDHLGRKPIIFLALLLEMVAMVLFIVAEGPWMLIAARIVQGIATGIAGASLGAALVDANPARGAVVNAISPLVGMAVGALVTSALVQFGPHKLHLIYVLLLVLFIAESALALTMPETSGKKPGAWAALKPRLAVPPQAKSAFLLITPINISTWMLGSFYLSLVPALVVATTGNRAPLVSGSMVAALMVVGAISVLLRRSKKGVENLRFGAVFTAIGVITVVTGINLGQVPVLLIGTLLCGIGFGTSFLGSTGHLLPLAKSSERAELLSAFYIESYLAFSLPAIAAGSLVRQVGYAVTADIFGAAIITLGAIGLFLLRRREVAVPSQPAAA